MGNTSKVIAIHIDFKSIGTPGKVWLMFEFLPAWSLAVVAAVGLLCPGVRDGHLICVLMLSHHDHETLPLFTRRISYPKNVG